MSAVMRAFSGSKDVVFNHEMEKEEKIKNSNGGESSELQNGGDEVNKSGRGLSFASLSDTENDDNGDGNDPSEDEDDFSKVGSELDLGPQFSLKEQLEKDKDDESLRKWKEQLLGSVDLSSVGENAEPEVQISSLIILSPGRPDLVLPVPFIPNSKGYAFSLKDGSHYRIKFSFLVSNNIVSGLKYKNTVWKSGIRVENKRVMLGTFSPQSEPYTYELEEETTPSGIFARGSYSARTKFIDDDNKCYLNINYSFEIRKEWPLPS